MDFFRNFLYFYWSQNTAKNKLTNLFIISIQWLTSFGSRESGFSDSIFVSLINTKFKLFGIFENYIQYKKNFYIITWLLISKRLILGEIRFFFHDIYINSNGMKIFPFLIIFIYNLKITECYYKINVNNRLTVYAINYTNIYICVVWLENYLQIKNSVQPQRPIFVQPKFKSLIYYIKKFTKQRSSMSYNFMFMLINAIPLRVD